MIPGVGAVADLANAAWYGYEGNYKQAALSLLSAAPGIGDLAGLAKFGKLYKAADNCLDAASGAGKVFNTVRNLERGANAIQGAVNVYDGYQNGSVVQMGLGLLGVGMAARSTQLPCFLAGTLVSTPDGPRRIDEILSGDVVWGYDLRRGEWRGCVVSYHSSIAYDDMVVTVRAGGAEVRSTYHHAYWVESGEELAARPVPEMLGESGMSIPDVPGRWVDAGDLRVGDVLVSRETGTTTVESIEVEHQQVPVFHIYVEEVHNYAVGDGEWLVHNGHTKGDGGLDDVLRDNIKATRKLRSLHPDDADVLDNALVPGKPSGSYVHTTSSGVQYVGKGTERRAMQSARELERRTREKVIKTELESALDDEHAFLQEAKKIRDRGGIDYLWNRINSPGESL